MARNKPPSFDFYPDDFIAGTLNMHPTSRGIYITLLCHQWSHGSIPNPTNIRQFVQITGAMPDELNEHLPEVLCKFEQQEDGTLVNLRMAGEYAKKSHIYEVRSAAGRASGFVRTNHEQNDEQTGNKKGTNQEVGSRKLEGTKKKKVSFDPTALAMPFASEEFANAWRDFCRMRREIKKPMRRTGAMKTLKMLGDMGEKRAIAALELTTANEWQGIREPETGRTTAKVPPREELGF